MNGATKLGQKSRRENMAQIVKRWYGGTHNRDSFGLSYCYGTNIDIVQLEDGTMGVTGHNTANFLEGPVATWLPASVIADVLAGLHGPADYECGLIEYIGSFPGSKQVWHCDSPSCKGREVDVGHVCYWCGVKQK